MKTTSLIILSFISLINLFGQTLPPKQAYPLDVKQIHSGHSLTDPLFVQPWPGQYVNAVAHVNQLQGWALFDVMIGKSTIPGSSINYRWNNPPAIGPDARHNIGNWELLCITERVPLLYEGGSTQQWYLDGIQEQREHLSLFVNNAWNNGNNGNGAPTLLWTTWTNIDDSDGPWRAMLDTQGEEFERMQDFANQNRPTGAPHVYLIPGHKMMARIYDDIQLGLVPGITNINQFFSDNIHTNSLGNYAIAMIHYACIFNQSPVGLPADLIMDANSSVPRPSVELALYLQTIVWEVVTSYSRTGITDDPLSTINILFDESITIYPNPTSNYIYISNNDKTLNSEKIIFNNVGSIVYKGTDNIIDLSNLSSGIYILKVENQIVKIVKD